MDRHPPYQYGNGFSSPCHHPHPHLENDRYPPPFPPPGHARLSSSGHGHPYRQHHVHSPPFSPPEHARGVVDDQKQQRNHPTNATAGPLRIQDHEHRQSMSPEYRYHRVGFGIAHSYRNQSNERATKRMHHPGRDQTRWSSSPGRRRNDAFYYHHRDYRPLTPPTRPLMAMATETSRNYKRRQEHNNHRPRHQQFETVTDALRDYTRRRSELQLYQVALVWNRLGKTLQKSRREERMLFSADNEGDFKLLMKHTMESVVKFNPISTAVATHSLAKLISLTNDSRCLHHVQPLWEALQRQTATHLRENKIESAQSIANTLWAYGKVGLKISYELVDDLSEAALECIEEFNPQELSTTAWACARLNHEAPTLLDAIAIAVEARIDDFNQQNLANTVWAFAKLNYKSPVLMDAIAAAAEDRIDDFKPQGISNTVWAFATLGCGAPRLWDVIANAAAARIDGFAPQNLATTALAYAKSTYKVPKLLDAIAAAAEARINDFKPQDLANMAWAYAKLSYKVPTLLDIFACAAESQIDDFTDQALANMAWAYATLAHDAPKLLDAIAVAAEARMNSFTPQHLANTAWAYAKLAHQAPTLLDAIATAVEARIDDFSSQALANTAWAYVTANHDVPTLFDVIANAAEARINEFKPQELVSTLWAYATRDRVEPMLLNAIATAVEARKYDFCPHELANTAWAYAKLNHEAPKLLDSIANTAETRIKSFNPRDLATTAWAYATLQHEAPRLLSAISHALEARIDDFSSQDLASTAWAYAVFDAHDEQFIYPGSPLFAKALLAKIVETNRCEEYSQLHQYFLWCRERAVNGDKQDMGWFPEELEHRCLDSFVSSEVHPSWLQKDVVSSLGTLEEVSKVQEEFLTSIGYRLDAVVLYRGCRIAVEVDGPSHFVGRSRRRNGNTVLKQRQLRSLEDWRLVSIPYWEWDEIADIHDASLEARKKAYLKALLDRVRKSCDHCSEASILEGTARST